MSFIALWLTVLAVFLISAVITIGTIGVLSVVDRLTSNLPDVWAVIINGSLFTIVVVTMFAMIIYFGGQ